MNKIKLTILALLIVFSAKAEIPCITNAVLCFQLPVLCGHMDVSSTNAYGVTFHSNGCADDTKNPVGMISDVGHYSCIPANDDGADFIVSLQCPACCQSLIDQKVATFQWSNGHTGQVISWNIYITAGHCATRFYFNLWLDGNGNCAVGMCQQQLGPCNPHLPQQGQPKIYDESVENVKTSVSNPFPGTWSMTLTRP